MDEQKFDPTHRLNGKLGEVRIQACGPIRSRLGIGVQEPDVDGEQHLDIRMPNHVYKMRRIFQRQGFGQLYT